MNSITWWLIIGVLAAASAIDVCTRRVPNWLVIPFLIVGITVRSASGGLSGAGLSLAGLGLAAVLFGIPCFLQGMGMGDLKLAAAIGAWIGPGQLFIAFVATGIAGGIIAAGYALWHGSLGQSLDGTADLLAHFAQLRIRPHQRIRLGDSGALSIPYAPAIAIGTIFSFFAR